ncbi:MAG TPA: GNAT family N-acetyltransferase [Vicinamibacteria bacterium]
MKSATEWRQGGYLVSTDASRLDVDRIHGFLRESYWARGVPREVVERSLRGSLCFGLYEWERQVGFARVITDGATFAYLADVFVLPSHRGRGLARWLMDCVMSQPQLQGLRRFLLFTRDAHGLYAHFGFEPLDRPEFAMAVYKPDVYEVVTT